MPPAKGPYCGAAAMHGGHESGCDLCLLYMSAVLKAVNLGAKVNIALSYQGHKILEVSAFESDGDIA